MGSRQENGRLEGGPFLVTVSAPLEGLRGRSYCFACVILDGECLCLYLKTVFSVFCSVFHQLVAMEKSFGAGSSVPLCVSISGPASCLSRHSPDGGGAGPHVVGRPFLCRHWSCISIPFGIRVSFLCSLTQQLYTECRPVAGIVLCSAGIKVTVARGMPISGRTLPECSYAILFLHCSSTSFSLQNSKD